MTNTQAAAPHRSVGANASTSPTQRLTAWPLRLAAVVAVSAQIVAAIGGVLLLVFWIWASINTLLLNG